MPSIQKRLVETMMTLPGTSIEEEFRSRNAAIDAVAAYCHFPEEGAAARPRARPSTRRASPTPLKKTNLQLAATEAEKQALSDAMLLVFTEKRTITCFLCLGEQSLPSEKRTYKFASPGDLTKHCKRKASGPYQRQRLAREQGLPNKVAAQAASSESRREHPRDGFLTLRCSTKAYSYVADFLFVFFWFLCSYILH